MPNAYLDEIATAIESQWIGEMLHRFVNAILPTEQSLICGEDALIDTGHIDTNTIVCVTFAGMEIEHKQQASSFKNNNFVALMLQTNVGL